jgi:hypothetical protein
MRGLGRLSTFDPLQGFVSYRFVLVVLGLAQDVSSCGFTRSWLRVCGVSRVLVVNFGIGRLLYL